MVIDNFDVNSVRNNFTLLLQLVVFSFVILGKAELLAHDNGLSAGEFELGSSESFLSVLDVVVTNSDGEKNGTNSNSGSLA